jgi:twinkle protein
MTYSDFQIEINTSKTTGEYYTTCPKCSADRKKKRVKCLSVNLEKKVWLCQHCGYKGGLTPTKPVKEYFIPVWTNNTSLSDKVVGWFKKRGISQKTLIEAKVTECEEWMPQIEKKANCISFNYFRKGKLVNSKFRDGAKNFKLVKDAELIFYNYDGLQGNTVIIVEGEIDALSFIEAGINYVISVPNGAVKSESQRLDYLDNCVELFDNIKTVILAVDNDEAGIYLRDELQRRLGADRCFKVDFNDCKDANEYLVKYGSIDLIELIKPDNLIPFPIEGIVSLSELKETSNDYFENGLKPGAKCGIKEYDDLISFEKGFTTTVTGIPNHGKSDWLDFTIIKLAVNHKWKFGIFSPENHPVAVHVSKLASKLIGKWFNKHSMNYAEKELAENYIFENFHFIRPSNELYSLENILDRAKQLVLQYGINGLVIDPYNRLEHQIPSGMSETHYVGRQFDILDAFKKKYNVHIFLVAHPTKIKKDKATGKFEIPNLYDISGSANFFNKSDNGISVYRNYDINTSDIYIQKVKFHHWGKQGFLSVKWDEASGRYYHANESPDYSNFLVNETQTEIKLQPNVNFEKEAPTRIAEPKQITEDPF